MNIFIVNICNEWVFSITSTDYFPLNIKSHINCSLPVLISLLIWIFCVCNTYWWVVAIGEKAQKIEMRIFFCNYYVIKYNFYRKFLLRRSYVIAFGNFQFIFGFRSLSYLNIIRLAIDYILLLESDKKIAKIN